MSNYSTAQKNMIGQNMPIILWMLKHKDEMPQVVAQAQVLASKSATVHDKFAATHVLLNELETMWADFPMAQNTAILKSARLGLGEPELKKLAGWHEGFETVVQTLPTIISVLEMVESVLSAAT